METSHPSALLPLQSENPAEHARAHAPDRQTPVAFIAPAHRTPQRPQFCESAATSTSHPLSDRASQSAVAGAQSEPHVPARQYDVLLGGVGHSLPHPPQFRTSVRGSMHSIEHLVLAGPLQPLTHRYAPATSWQSGIGSWQRVPHDPQVPGTSSRASQPLAASPSQSAKPALQAKPQAPIAQVAVALLGTWQGLQRAPQLSTDVSSEQVVPQRW